MNLLYNVFCFCHKNVLNLSKNASSYNNPAGQRASWGGWQLTLSLCSMNSARFSSVCVTSAMSCEVRASSMLRMSSSCWSSLNSDQHDRNAALNRSLLAQKTRRNKQCFQSAALRVMTGHSWFCWFFFLRCSFTADKSGSNRSSDVFSFFTQKQDQWSQWQTWQEGCRSVPGTSTTAGLEKTTLWAEPRSIVSATPASRLWTPSSLLPRPARGRPDLLQTSVGTAGATRSPDTSIEDALCTGVSAQHHSSNLTGNAMKTVGVWANSQSHLLSFCLFEALFKAASITWFVRKAWIECGFRLGTVYWIQCLHLQLCQQTNTGLVSDIFQQHGVNKEKAPFPASDLLECCGADVQLLHGARLHRPADQSVTFVTTELAMGED